MATKNAAGHPVVHHETPTDCVLTNLSNTADALNQSREAHSFSEPSFTNLLSQDGSQLWENFASFGNNDGPLKHDGSTSIEVLTLRGEATLHAQHNRRQHQTYVGYIDNIQPVRLDAPWNWPGDIFNNDFMSIFEDDTQLLISQPGSTVQGFVIPDPLRGVPTVDQLEPVNAATLGPQYEEPMYEEFFHNLDFFKDAAFVGKFGPTLSNQVGFPLAGRLEPIAILPEFSEAFRNEAHGAALNVQGLSTLPKFFLPDTLNDVWDGVSKQWIPPQLLGHCKEEVDQAAKHPYLDAGIPPNSYARTKESMTSAHANSNRGPLSQIFSKVPYSPGKQSQFLYPRNVTQARSSESFQVFQLKAPVPHGINSKVTRAPAQSSENVCLQCKTRKKQCIPTDRLSQSQSACIKCLSLANKDEGIAKTLCVRPKDLDMKLVNPDIYFDSYVAIAQQVPVPLSSTVQRQVAVHLTCLVKEIPHLPTLWKSTALICNVEEYKLKSSDNVAIDMVNYQTFNDLRYSLVGGLHSRRMPSVGIIKGQVPRLPDLVRWAMSTLAIAPHGALFGLQGPIYQFASLYIKQEHRPLRELVELALMYAAIYNFCIGQMSLQLSPASPVLYKIPPKLRVQICGPLREHHMKLGEQLQKSMLKALYSRHGPEKEDHVPLCIVLWLLMTVCRHNLNDSAMPAFMCDVIEEIDVKNLEVQEKMLLNLSRTHQAICKALFRRDPKSVCPIFNDALVKLCGIGKKDVKLLEKLQSLRTAVRQFKQDAIARSKKGRTQDNLECLTDLFGLIELDSHQSSVAVPDGAVNANIVEDSDEGQTTSSTCSESLRILGQEGDKSQMKGRAKAEEASKLRVYWLARCMQGYDSQAWLFGY